MQKTRCRQSHEDLAVGGAECNSDDKERKFGVGQNIHWGFFHKMFWEGCMDILANPG